MINDPHRHNLSPSRWQGNRVAAVLIALVLLLGALITPSGLVKSHGGGVPSGWEHAAAWQLDDGHGHSHEDDALATSDGHPHHSGDHSHDNAHALPVGLPKWSGPKGSWRFRPVHAGPWPSLDGLERPPRT